MVIAHLLYAWISVTDLRIGQIGHGLGSRALGAPCNSFLRRLNVNEKFAKLRRDITSQFTLKREEMQMSTLDSYQYICTLNNTTILCIMGVREMQAVCMKAVTKKWKRKKRYFIDVQFSTDKKLSTTQNRQTPEMSGLSYLAIQIQSWIFKTQSKPNHSWKFLIN